MRGERPTYHVFYRQAPDDGMIATVAELPYISFRSTSRKGVPLAARARIGLELELAEESFDVTVTYSRRRRRSAR